MTKVSLPLALAMPSFTEGLPGRNEMAIFVTQGRFTREYIRSGLAKPEDR